MEAKNKWPKFLTSEEVKEKLEKFNKDHDYEELARGVPEEQSYAFLYPHIMKQFDKCPSIGPDFDSGDA